jgi:dihydrodipicolinate reductase
MKAFPTVSDQTGMDLRDYFAAKAMQEFISELRLVWTENTILDINIAAKFAYKVADAMMEARK